LVETFERVAAALPDDAEFRGVELVARRARRAGRTTTLSLIVDRVGGVDLRTCERIATRLNAELDREPEPYTLEVESAGLERPLFGPADFERFGGRPVRIVTTVVLRGQKTHRGMLGGVCGETAILQQPAGEFPIPFALIKSANLEFDPREDLRREKRERKGSKRLLK
jgi:ribosome maturation factor RimP